MNLGAIRDLPTTKASSPQQPVAQASDRLIKPRTQAQATASAEQSNLTTKISGGAAIGTAVAAAQAVNMQKSSPRVISISTRPGDGTSPDRFAGATIRSRENEHPSSRAVPDGWPAVVPEDEPAVDTDADTAHSQEREARLASLSLTIDHTETAAARQSVPSAEQEPAQQLHLRQSSSPGRSARFAKLLSVTAAGDQVHEPPPRSVSPAKSALKHGRGNSLSPDREVEVAGRIIQPPSVTSDGTSVASDEGSRIGVRKRPVKVSFDDEAEIVGVASPPTSPENLTPESPTEKHKSRRGWFGVGKKKSSPSDYTAGHNDFEEVMKPRPALPSFGSVRGNREAGPSSPTIQEFSDNESSSSSESNVPVGPGTSFSHDHAFGGMLPTVQRKDTQPPHGVDSLQRKSVTGETPSQGLVGREVKPERVPVAGVTEQGAYSGGDSNIVPTIAVEPATPQEEKQSSSLEQYRIPGGFPQSGSNRNVKTIAATHEAKPVASAVPKLDDMDTEGESGDSIYSDAAEDIEGDGFGSINAIVDGRTTPRTSAPLETSESREATPKPTKEPAVVDSHSRDVTDQTVDEFRSETPTQASFSGQFPVSAPNEAAVGSPLPSSPTQSTVHAPSMQHGAVRPQPKWQGAMSIDTQEILQAQEPPWSSNSTSPKTDKGKPRAVSLGPAFQVSPAFPSTLRQTLSNGSNSSSSFKRTSPLSPRGDGPRTMRQTMRAGKGHEAVRAESPNEYRPRSSGSTKGTMRTTLRGPLPGNERYSFFPTKKKAQWSGKSPLKLTRGSRFDDSDDEESGAQSQFFRSRFADSSDEDEPGSNALRPVRGIPRRQGTYDGDSTELEDSSEEDRRSEPVIIHRVGSAPPEPREHNVAPNMSGMAAVARQRGMTQRELEEFLMQPPRGRKPGLLTRLGLKKPKNPEHRIRKADVESPSRRDTPLERLRLEREQLREEPWAKGNHEGPTSSPKLLKRITKRHTAVGESWPLRADPKDKADTVGPAVAEQRPSTPTSPLRSLGDNTDCNGNIVVKGADAPKEPESPQTVLSEPLANLDHNGPSAREVVIAGSGRTKRKRFPLIRRAFHLRLPSMHKD